MNTTSFVLGILAVGFGLFTLYVRFAHPSWFGKLEAMKKQWGSATGNAMRIFGYTIVPIVVGIALIVAGIKGISLFSR